MQLTLLAVGEKMPAWVVSAVQEYLKRLPKELACKLVEVAPEPRAAGKSVAVLLKREAVRLHAALPQNAFVILLDERGEQWSSEQLAREMQSWLQNQSAVAFIIGGADGVEASVRADARRVLSLSKFTLPHGLARVVLAEQLYRASSILKGHPYHRA